jgi:beta-glucanase (GH16 family)
MHFDKALSISIGLIVGAQGAVSATDGEHAGYELVWSDEFNTDKRINKNDWKIVRGNGCPQLCGFGNDERQTYTSKKRNLRIEDGKLVIEAHRRKAYTSAKVTTQKMPGWQYGKIEVRAKLPTGLGTWPAIWMLPDENGYGSWPKSGEIDIMEHVGFREGFVHGTVHTKAYNHKINTQRGHEIQMLDATSIFHVYAIEWSANSIRWFVDSKQYYQFNKLDGDGFAEWPFDQPFHLILNLAVGGSWGGKHGVDRNAFPARFEIDWVRVWQSKDEG